MTHHTGMARHDVEDGRQPVRFELLHRDARTGARRARLVTRHGTVELPAFMPVGTQGSVKGIPVAWLREIGTQMVLANTYHLMLRPGADRIAALGGLQRFTAWEGPMLTDSGGFQVYSLGESVQVTDRGAVFRSHIDGRTIAWRPEDAMEVQAKLGSDIAMVLDDVVRLPAPADRIEQAMWRSVAWAARCRDVPAPPHQVRFGIVQGGLDLDLRRACTERLVALDFAGYAIGGLSVGEPPEQMHAIVRASAPWLPEDRPRYLMGVGRPEDLLVAIGAGIDLFDCVLPTRNGRNATAFTTRGIVRLRNRCHADDPRPLDPDCPSPASPYSRAFLRHLFQAGEMLGPVLVSAHNLAYYQQLMREAREAIEADRFEAFCVAQRRRWREGDRAS